MSTNYLTAVNIDKAAFIPYHLQQLHALVQLNSAMLPETLGPLAYESIYSFYKVSAESALYGIELASPYFLWLARRSFELVSRAAPIERALQIFLCACGINAISTLSPNSHSLSEDIEEAYEFKVAPYLPSFVKIPLEALARLLRAGSLYDSVRFGIGCASIYFFPYAFCYSLTMNIAGYSLSCFILSCIDSHGAFKENKNAKFTYAKQAAGLSSAIATLSSIFIGDFFSVVPTALLTSAIFSIIQFARHNSLIKQPSAAEPEQASPDPTSNTKVVDNHWMADKVISSGYESLYFVSVILYKSLSLLTLAAPLKHLIESNLGPLKNSLNEYVEDLESKIGNFTERYMVEPAVTLARSA